MALLLIMSPAEAFAPSASTEGREACNSDPRSGVDCAGDDLQHGTVSGVADAGACCAKCAARGNCVAWTHHAAKKHCYLKSGCTGRKARAGFVSGTLAPSPPPPGPSPSPGPSSCGAGDIDVVLQSPTQPLFGRPGMPFSTAPWFSMVDGATNWQQTPQKDAVLTFRVTNRSGRGVPGCRLLWDTGAGRANGWAFPVDMNSVTDANGRVMIYWMAGSANRQTLTASIAASGNSVSVQGASGGQRTLAPAPYMTTSLGSNGISWEGYSITAKLTHFPPETYNALVNYDDM